MTKYNKSEIMKSAWNLVKTQALTISLALKQAWSSAKNMPNIDDTLFLTDKNSQFVKETEKALCYKIAFMGWDKDMRAFRKMYNIFWLPKSAIVYQKNGLIGFAKWIKEKLNLNVLKGSDSYKFN